MDASTGLWAVFTSSFLAATLLPGGSEIALYGVLKLHPDAKWMAVAVATLGNTLGALTSYGIGRVIPRSKPLRRSEGGTPRPVKGVECATPQSTPVKGLALVQRYGAPILLLSWVPIVGDPLCVAAGWLRINAASATFFIAAGKLARYIAVAALAA